MCTYNFHLINLCCTRVYTGDNMKLFTMYLYVFADSLLCYLCCIHYTLYLKDLLNFFTLFSTEQHGFRCAKNACKRGLFVFFLNIIFRNMNMDMSLQMNKYELMFWKCATFVRTVVGRFLHPFDLSLFVLYLRWFIFWRIC